MRLETDLSKDNIDSILNDLKITEWRDPNPYSDSTIDMMMMNKIQICLLYDIREELKKINHNNIAKYTFPGPR